MPRMDLTIEERVDAGIRFLDEKVPDWRNKVNPATLDIGNSWNCPLGQIYGIYVEGLRWLGLTSMTASRYGFERDHYTQNIWDDINALNAEWRRRLTQG